MNTPLTHDHVFLGQDHRRNERRVWWVIALTAGMMVVEIIAGNLYGSMALVADGWHMSTHAGAMLITALAYGYARRQARNPRFTFGTGKLGELAGFASAIVLALIALIIGWDSLARLVDPVPIRFDEAIAIAAAGLVVNLVSAWLLKDDHGHAHGHGGHGHDHDHDHGHDHDHDHDHAHSHASPSRAHAPAAAHAHPQRSHDNNLRSAYVHVLADALTSVLAIAALLAGRSYGWLWADPAMGVVGALVIARWSWGLIRDSGTVLLDAAPQSGKMRRDIEQALDAGDGEIADLHVWQVGPGHYAAIVSLVTRHPRDSAFYKAKLAHIAGLSHLTVETQASP
ncbi:MAG: CDF family Co(II)/Ni(II) efflux transporter DmeF [Achromobacter sp.]|jgi:cation diffusion facilitator family transporter|uniref:Cadmium, cobalt and zinc/H(+)-K(+) antiporter n=1 Tax=Achromobacter insuavis TaxID=1287735 RepID=A0A6J5HHV6_9BURK|nr:MULTISPECIES: CDF family Co(II)/Ni(II) efflux transporter DmeF [Achromobacter]MBN9639318.1 CDF family Co(II)/Ni(II) efflux transporter DmeF [Achromobacter sp.]CAB3701506.1 Cadmium, cobalt and zinc/H(+)-K(+) antiporter [Achromobacter insuavis]CAB3834652.1 Cadmium, cobalt and zinc/H(+)-K(+) antiporter [Achromobacter insuavis]CUI42114.1 Cadmium%2C cobalt and zinc/H(+)-K(+) antiporter [Achromobacter sp. 2789STDY5608628]CUI48221.1 Cadmium%2C cobalt and zinc/H(+)-K(+) antiporter [Achromobacter sp